MDMFTLWTGSTCTCFSHGHEHHQNGNHSVYWPVSLNTLILSPPLWQVLTSYKHTIKIPRDRRRRRASDVLKIISLTLFNNPFRGVEIHSWTHRIGITKFGIESTPMPWLNNFFESELHYYLLGLGLGLGLGGGGELDFELIILTRLPNAWIFTPLHLEDRELFFSFHLLSQNLFCFHLHCCLLTFNLAYYRTFYTNKNITTNRYLWCWDTSLGLQQNLLQCFESAIIMIRSI